MHAFISGSAIDMITGLASALALFSAMAFSNVRGVQ